MARFGRSRWKFRHAACAALLATCTMGFAHHRGAPPAPLPASHACVCSEVAFGGSWSGSGVDTAKTRWDWTGTFKQQRCTVTGAFQWKASNGTAGTEYVEGHIACSGKKVTLQGKRVKRRSGPLTTARYSGAFADGHRAVKGSWTDGIPGRWWGRKR